MVVMLNDGGRAAAGFEGTAHDCVARSIAIVTGRPYRQIWDRLAAIHAAHRGAGVLEHARGERTADEGVPVQAPRFKAYLRELGLRWTATRRPDGYPLRLTLARLPPGRLVVVMNRHCCAVIDGVVHDAAGGIHPDGSRVVFGYYRPILKRVAS